mmetsp:Transcript_45759/g.115182  ORF Transcript_45759/g.115182 Transcript_45759/m.115182 type:complete len:268 (-) Transcript_45759:8-811(-)
MAKALRFVEDFVRLLERTEGRDKIMKTILYGSKLLRWVVARRVFDSMPHRDSVFQILTSLLDETKEARRMFRFGKCVIGYIYLFHVVKKGEPPSLLGLVTLLNQINMAHYFFCDHIVWLLRHGVISQSVLARTEALIHTQKPYLNLDSIHRWGLLSWFHAMLWALLAEGLNFYNTAERERALTRAQAREGGKVDRYFLMNIAREMEAVKAAKFNHALNFAVVTSDLLLSGGLAGVINLNDGALGALGCCSALVGVYQTLKSIERQQA